MEVFNLCHFLDKIIYQPGNNKSALFGQVADDDNEPGFYIVPHHYLDEAAGPFDTFDQAEEAAWECLRSREQRQLQEECAAEGVTCPPVRIIESKNSALALQGRGPVWWIDGKQKGPPVDPRQTGFTAGF